MNIKRRLCELGCFFCLILLAGCAGVSSQTPSVDKLRQQAATGDKVAERSMGVAYDFGEGVRQSYTEAAKWYQLSADQGVAMAQNSLGRMYDTGIGVQANYAEANKWYLLAAQQGDAEAMFNLGKNYGFGRGVTKDLVQAFMWLDMARFFTQHSPDMKTKWIIRHALDDLKVYMTPEEIKEGERL